MNLINFATRGSPDPKRVELDDSGILHIGG
jgi:hypothetical protein